MPDDNSPEMLEINNETVSSLQGKKTLKHHKKMEPSRITSIDFSDDGSGCLTASAGDEHLQLFDCINGTHIRGIGSEKYGCELAKYTHSNDSCLHTATKDKKVRYLSLKENKYVRYFTGHSERVNALEVSPSDSSFLTASMDNTIRLWDFRQEGATGQLGMPAPSLTAFDPTGKVFAVANVLTGSIGIFDLRNPTSGPFHTIKGIHKDSRWDKLEFSNDGRLLLLGTSGYQYLFDAFTGDGMGALAGLEALAPRQSGMMSPVAFTTDGQFVVAGSADHTVSIWNVNNMDATGTAHPIHLLNAPHDPYLLAFNPKMYLMATANTELTFWLPSI